MINIRTLAMTVSALALVSSPGFAASGNHQGFYVGGGAGVTFPQDDEITSKIIGELEAGRVDAFMTDYPYSRRLLDNVPGSFEEPTQEGYKAA